MKKHIIFSPRKGNTYIQKFDNCINQLQNVIKLYDIKKINILKLTVFIDINNYQEYSDLITSIKNNIIQFFNGAIPPISFIPQAPSYDLINLEAMLLIDEVPEIIEFKSCFEHNYIKITYLDREEIIACGLRKNFPIANIYEQSFYSFDILKSILVSENFSLSNIVRQWNYIENIDNFSNYDDGLKQNYQVFNDVRTIFYNKTIWENGYPAATGIGIILGGIIIDFIAIKPKKDVIILPLANPKQIDAHKYSESLLLGNSLRELNGKTTPKFERAKIISYSDIAEVYISGTAAILGQDSLSDMDIETQTVVTIENILELVSVINLNNNNIHTEQFNCHFEFLRAYIKNRYDFESVKNVCKRYFPEIPIIYLNADVCRKELLVEIEGIMTIKH